MHRQKYKCQEVILASMQLPKMCRFFVDVVDLQGGEAGKIYGLKNSKIYLIRDAFCRVKYIYNTWLDVNATRENFLGRWTGDVKPVEGVHPIG